jgi:hypothetical protein
MESFMENLSSVSGSNSSSPFSIVSQEKVPSKSSTAPFLHESKLETAGGESSCCGFIYEWCSWIVGCIYQWICPSAKEEELDENKKYLVDLQISMKQETLTMNAFKGKVNQFPKILREEFVRHFCALADQKSLKDVSPEDMQPTIKDLEKPSNESEIGNDNLVYFSATITWLLNKGEWTKFYNTYLTGKDSKMTNKNIVEEFHKVGFIEFVRLQMILNGESLEPKEQKKKTDETLKKLSEAEPPLNKNEEFKQYFHRLGLPLK